MPDIIDDANAAAETFHAASMSYRKHEAPDPTGYCLNCDEVLDPMTRWCDVDCRDDWQKRMGLRDSPPADHEYIGTGVYVGATVVENSDSPADKATGYGSEPEPVKNKADGEAMIRRQGLHDVE